MRQRELYTLSKRIRKINRAEQELWMRGFVIYPLIIGLSCIDGVTLYEVFFKMTESAEKEAVYRNRQRSRRIDVHEIIVLERSGTFQHYFVRGVLQ